LCCFGVLIKLSYDDLRMRLVYERDLIVLNMISLVLWTPKPVLAWVMLMGILGILILLSARFEMMGSGDLAVILAMMIMMEVPALWVAIQSALLLALIASFFMKKTAREALPFLPFLSLGMSLVYLIRLRLIFS